MAHFTWRILTKTLIQKMYIVFFLSFEQPSTSHVADKGCPLNGGRGEWGYQVIIWKAWLWNIVRQVFWEHLSPCTLMISIVDLQKGCSRYTKATFFIPTKPSILFQWLSNIVSPTIPCHVCIGFKNCSTCSYSSNTWNICCWTLSNQQSNEPTINQSYQSNLM